MKKLLNILNNKKLNKELKRCEVCNRSEKVVHLHGDNICTSCKFYKVCGRCQKTKHILNVLDDGICKYCHKQEQKIIKKIQNGYKLCPFCGEQVKFIAIKCRFCHEIIKQNNGENISEKNNSEKIKVSDDESAITYIKAEKENDVFFEQKNSKIPIIALIFGVLSIFFYEIGIIPTVALVLSIIAIVKYKKLDKKRRIFSIIGLILSTVYFIMSLVSYGHIKTTGVINTGKAIKSYSEITWMDYKNIGAQGVINWSFENGRYKGAWDCYKGCEMNFTNKNGDVMFSGQMPERNGCDTWYSVPKTFNPYIDKFEEFCINISCDDGKASDSFCFEKK